MSQEKNRNPVVWPGNLLSRLEAQSWPQGALYVIATPIGNLMDLSLRAWQALQRCDVIAAEDTRTTRILLDAWGVTTPCIAAHRHNEAQAAAAIVARLQQNERVALVSDAGAPAVSDPGARIVHAVRTNGIQVIPIPGPSAVITALMASGITDDANPGFAFAGFIPSKAVARQKWLEQWQSWSVPVLMFETPHRLLTSLQAIIQVCGDSRILTLARELTKRFEEVHTLPAAQLLEWLRQNPQSQQGECVLILHKADKVEPSSQELASSGLIDALLEVCSRRDAAKVLAKAGLASRDKAYKLVLSRAADLRSV